MNPENNGLILSIDIGTNNSCGCYFNPITNKAEIIEYEGSLFVPSFFGYSKLGKALIGKAAKKAFCDGVSEVIGRAKYLVGKEVNRDSAAFYSEMCGMPVIVNQQGYCHFHLPKIGIDVDPSELYKRMIKLYVSILENKHIGQVDTIRLTVPASFTAYQRALVKHIAEECGFESEKVSIINEPSAAAYMYWHSEQQDQGTFLVYDFGGGTFDISLVGVKNGELEVLDYGGDANLGGCNIDSAIANLYQTEIEGRNLPIIKNTMPENVQKRIIGKLLSRCEECKIKLGYAYMNQAKAGLLLVSNDDDDKDSNEEETEEQTGDFTSCINIADALFVTGTNDVEDDAMKDYTYMLTGEEMIALSQPYIDRTVALVEELLANNHLEGKDITSVIVVGGSSLLPSIRSSLLKIFSPEQILNHLPVKEVTTLGACYSLLEKYGLKERSTYSLGVELKKNKVRWLIPKNKPLPYECNYPLVTTVDYQTYIVTNVVQGNSLEEKTSKEKKLIRLGTICENIKTIDKKGKVSFNITFTFETDGCVLVKIYENNSESEILTKSIEWNHCDVCCSNTIIISGCVK